MERKRIRKATEMRHVKVVNNPPDSAEYISLREFMAGIPASKKDKVGYKNAIHYLLERELVTGIAIPRRQRARRYYRRDEIHVVRAALAIHRNGVMLDKAYEMAKRRGQKEKEGPQAKLF